jgi:hypothetical protein
MAGPSEPGGTPPGVDTDLETLFRDPDARAWMRTHLADLRSSVAQHRFRNRLVWVGVVAGLIAHIAGYLLRTSGPAEPLGLAADLLYSFGLAVWTGTVVVVLIEIIPQAKERQILEAIDAYEAAVSGGDSKRGT